jgi:hypothetical protein
VGGKGDRPAVENRWWVDQTKDGSGRAIPVERPPAQFGGRFFQTGEGFDQDRARLRLTDSNLKWLEEGNPPPNDWASIQMLPRERFSEGRLRRARGVLRLPPGGRGVLVDSGTALRAIMTADPPGERLVEVRLGDESSFDAWIRNEWVREVLFRDFDDAMRRLPRLLRQYLSEERGAPLL